VSGTVLGAGVWFLTVDVPVDYDEPVEITMYSETDDTGSQYGGATGADFRLRDRHTHEQNADLTYESFHQYITFDNPTDGKDNLEVTVSLTVQDLDGSENDIGFAIFEGEVNPVDVEWTFVEPTDAPDYWQASYGVTDYEVQRETDDFTRTLPADDGEDTTVTVIYTNRNRDSEDGDPYNVDGANIEWFFEDTTEE